LFLHLLTGLLIASALATTTTGKIAAQDPPRGVGAWDAKYGSHRARIYVSRKAEAVRVHIEWRRPDRDPEKKDLLVVDAATGRTIRNVVRLAINREYGDIVFQPETAPGEYEVYYLPSVQTGSPYFPVVTYPAPHTDADPDWIKRYALTPGDPAAASALNLPEARVLEIQARSEFDRFDPMEVIATKEETNRLLATHPDAPYLLFPEGHAHPIRMTQDLPLRWIEQGPETVLTDQAERGQFYAFQVGVWAARAPLEGVHIRFSTLRGQGGASIPASAFRCINQNGTDWLGRKFTPAINVPQGEVQALWCGVQIPVGATPGEYTGHATVQPKGLPARTVNLALTVTPGVAVDAGDGDLASLSRIRWLDSTIGLDDEVVAPYTPLRVRGSNVELLGRSVRFGADGFPASIVSKGHEILQRPMALVVETSAGQIMPRDSRTRTVKRVAGAITRETRSESGPLELICQSKLEADGYLNMRVQVTAQEDVDLKDVRLEIPIRRPIATYMMGMGCKGGYRPANWDWTWNIDRANNMLWVGDVEAGLQCKLKGEEETWDLYNLKTSGIPAAWGNDGHGGCSVREEGSNTVLIRAYTGPRKLAAGATLHFNFGLLITPVKPLDPAHWHWRYDHELVTPEQAVQNGATIVNIHQGNALNPNINYPFVATPKLADYVRKAHEQGLKVKIYYTVRELSNYTAEIWALRSLNHEVFVDGPGGGDHWLQEHLASHYSPAWHTPLEDGTVDAAIATAGLSRWHNYYLEGLGWLIKNVGIDGLYLDGIGYDREIMKRVRKVMDRARPGCLIDFHSGNNYAPEYGLNSCASQYMEHFPYINSLWFGEGFNYNESPDYWLVEISGIPFGLYGEMLQDNGNPWRGMVYGMTARYYSGADPKHIWKLWDDFGIADAKMIGYWSPDCPVHTGSPEVLATAYVRHGKTLISLASWANSPVSCRLQINWTALGLDPKTARLQAPAVQGFQPATEFSPDAAIPVEPGKGWLLVVE
jgi:hypothetical protein